MMGAGLRYCGTTSLLLALRGGSARFFVQRHLIRVGRKVITLVVAWSQTRKRVGRTISRTPPIRCCTTAQNCYLDTEK